MYFEVAGTIQSLRNRKSKFFLPKSRKYMKISPLVTYLHDMRILTTSMRLLPFIIQYVVSPSYKRIHHSKTIKQCKSNLRSQNLKWIYVCVPYSAFYECDSPKIRMILTLSIFGKTWYIQQYKSYIVVFPCLSSTLMGTLHITFHSFI